MNGQESSGAAGAPSVPRPTPPVLRAALPEEAATLSDLAFRSKAVWGYGPEFMERCRPLLTVTTEDIRDGTVVVAERAGRVVGFHSLRRRGGDLELDLLFVAPDAIGTGVGTALLLHAREAAADLGFPRLVLESDPGAEPFYARHGASRIGTVASTVEAGRVLPFMAIPALGAPAPSDSRAPAPSDSRAPAPSDSRAPAPSDSGELEDEGG